MKGPVGDNEVILTSFFGSETVSQLFSFQIEFLSTKLQLTAKDLIGKSVLIEVAQKNVGDRGDADVRNFHGYITSFSAGSISPFKSTAGSPARTYHAEVAPWLWFLTRAARSHIFLPDKEEKSIYEIVEDVIKRAKDFHVKVDWDGGSASELKNRKVSHCVQYRETDFNFLSRILEQYGVYYFFEHSQDSHKLILSSKPTTFKCKESSVDFRPMQENSVRSWEHSFEFVSGKFEQADYNFETPLDDLKSNSSKVGELVPDSTKYEVYEYPGEFSKRDEGDSEARIRQEEEEVSHSQVRGSSSCRSFSCGYKFKLAYHPEKESKGELGEYMLTSLRHHAEEPYLGSGVGVEYTNSFTCVPASIRYRPPRMTPKPVVTGIQTAVVSGPAGEEIHTDKHGRVKVCFHWDRETKKIKDSQGENCSCWVRVAQAMAGRKYGFMAIPRVGQEVVVEFEEGDPDRPLVVGSVYNADQPPHYNPEEHKTRSYFKTNSSPGGDGFNELMFDDKGGDERLYMHAQKDMDVVVENDFVEHILNDRHKKVDGNQLEKIKGNCSLHAVGDRMEKVANQSLEAEQKINMKAGMVYAMEGGTDVHIKAGMNLVLEAGMTLSLVVGGNSIVLDPTGVSITGAAMVNISGTLVNINSGPGSSPGSGAGCSPSPPEDPIDAHEEQTGEKSSD